MQVRYEFSCLVHNMNIKGDGVCAAVFFEPIHVPVPFDFITLERFLYDVQMVVAHFVSLAIVLHLYASAYVADSLAAREFNISGVELGGIDPVLLKQFVVKKRLHFQEIPLSSIYKVSIGSFILVLEFFFSEIVIDYDSHSIFWGNSWVICHDDRYSVSYYPTNYRCRIGGSCIMIFCINTCNKPCHRHHYISFIFLESNWHTTRQSFLIGREIITTIGSIISTRRNFIIFITIYRC